MATEQKCCACGKHNATNDGMCFGCLLEYAKHQSDFEATQPPVEEPK
jgi:NMD protein affecting ribosome stability and mRNA decay